MKLLPYTLMYSLLFLVAGQTLQGQGGSERIEPITTEEDAALEKARALFPAFQQTMLTDEEAAQEAFEPFLELPDEMQQRLQIWLDKEWTKKRRAYQNSLNRSLVSGGGRLTSEQLQKIKEDRETLNEIKAMDDLDAIKKELKAKGWPAMESLLKATKRSKSRTSDTRTANPKETARLLEEALRVGDFRYSIRKNRGEIAAKPHQDLGVADPDGDATDEEKSIADSIRMAQANQSVLADNEQIKDEIPRAEYEGIFEVNEWRIAAGLNALLIDPKLCEAARDHSKDMADLGFFAHDSPVKGKKTPWDRAQKFATTASAENIAINNSPADSNMAWFYSPGHHKNMFSTKHTHIGLGIHGRHYTQLFR